MQRSCAISALLALAAAAVARADLLWDNGEFRRHAGSSGERDTLVPDSWTVDDVILGEPAIVRGFEWFTLVTDDLDPTGSDMLVLDAMFQPLVELRDLPFTRTLEGVAFGLDYYRVTLSGLDIELSPGRYYVGARMVGDGVGRSYTGLDLELRGDSEAYFRSEHFDFPDWTPMSHVTGTAYDMSFTLYGDIVPAPATLAIALPALLVVHRRR